MYFEQYLTLLSPEILASSHDSVTQALAGQLGKLGRIFNNYPLTIAIHNVESKDDSPSHHAISPKLTTKWIDHCNAILLFKSQNAPAFNQDDNCKIHLNSEVEKSLKNFATDIIKHACKDLLDSNGALKKNIISLLKLENLIQAHQHDKSKMDQILFQMIYSYCTQIIIANFIIELEKKKINREQINLFNLSIQKLFCGISPKGIPQWTSFFTNQLYDFIFENSVFSEKSCAEFIRAIPTDRISDFIHIDIISMTELRDVNNLFQKLRERRSKFWIKVLEYLQTNNDVDHLQAIWQLLPKDTQTHWNNQSRTLHLPLHDQEMSGLSESKTEREGKPNPADENYRQIRDYSAVMNWIATRDNQFLLDHIIFSLLHNDLTIKIPAGELVKNTLSYLSTTYANFREENTALGNELQNFKFAQHYIRLPSNELFKYILENTKYKVLLGKVLQIYMPDLAVKAGLNIIDTDNPIASAIANNHWNLVISSLLNKQTLDEFEAKDINALSANESQLSTQLMKYLQTHYEKTTAQLAMLTLVLEGKNALGLFLNRKKTWTDTASSVWTMTRTFLPPTSPRQSLLAYKTQLESMMKIELEACTTNHI